MTVPTTKARASKPRLLPHHPSISTSRRNAVRLTKKYPTIRHRILHVLRAMGTAGATRAELADYLGLERSTVSGLADRAERRGFVARKASDADGRSTRLGLTAEGAELARHASRTVAAQLGPLVGQLPGQLRESLPALLTALRQPGRGAPNLRR